MRNPLVAQTFGSHYTDPLFVLKKFYQCEQLYGQVAFLNRILSTCLAALPSEMFT